MTEERPLIRPSATFSPLPRGEGYSNSRCVKLSEGPGEGRLSRSLPRGPPSRTRTSESLGMGGFRFGV